MFLVRYKNRIGPTCFSISMWGLHVGLINYLTDWHVNNEFFLIITKLRLHSSIDI